MDDTENARPSAVSPPTEIAESLLLNRELSWLDWNRRVLSLAEDPVPASARAREVPRDRVREPRRVLPGARRGPARTGGRRRHDAHLGWAHAARAAERDSSSGSRAAAGAGERAAQGGPAGARGARHPPGLVERDRAPRTRRACGRSSRSRSCRCSHRRRSTAPIPFPYVSNLSLNLAVVVRDASQRREPLRAREGARTAAALLRAAGRGALPADRASDRRAPRRALPRAWRSSRITRSVSRSTRTSR